MLKVGRKNDRKKPDLLIYSSINSRATLIDSVAYLLAYGKTFKNTACACYSSAAINRADTVWNIILNPKCFIILSYLATARSGNVGSVVFNFMWFHG